MRINRHNALADPQSVSAMDLAGVRWYLPWMRLVRRLDRLDWVIVRHQRYLPMANEPSVKRS